MLWNTESPSLVTLLAIRLQRAYNKLFWRVFITWYCKTRINRSLDKFIWGIQHFLKKGVFPKYTVRSNRGEILYKIAVLQLWPKTLKNTFYGRPYSNISIVNIFKQMKRWPYSKSIKKNQTDLYFLQHPSSTEMSC